MTPISAVDLPNELLTIIFKFCHLGVLVSTQPPFILPDPDDELGFIIVQRPPTERKVFEDIHSPSLFPYALALMCPLWMVPLVTVPDSGLASSSISTLLNSPSPLFIDTPDEEKARIRGTTDIVSPHIGRCKTIRYEVTYTSSLPCVATDFCGEAPLLKN